MCIFPSVQFDFTHAKFRANQFFFKYFVTAPGQPSIHVCATAPAGCLQFAVQPETGVA